VDSVNSLPKFSIIPDDTALMQRIWIQHNNPRLYDLSSSDLDTQNIAITQSHPDNNQLLSLPVDIQQEASLSSQFMTSPTEEMRLNQAIASHDNLSQGDEFFCRTLLLNSPFFFLTDSILQS